MATRGQWLAVSGIVAGLVGALVVGVAFTPEVREVGVGSRAPDFRAVRVPGGDTATLADYENEVVLLNIWGTFCAPCEQEMPSMQRLYEQLGPNGLQVVAVSIDVVGSKSVLDWVQQRQLTFDILHDRSGRIERDYAVTGYPESFVIDREGTIVKKVIGAREWDDPVQVRLFRRLLDLDDAEMAHARP